MKANNKNKDTPICDFIKNNFRHFNSAALVDASEGWIRLLEGGGKMMLTMAGAMSTGELGISLAEMIRQNKVHAITTTGANLEEDIFNLVAHNHYERVPGYRSLAAKEEIALRDRGMNRVTDTCIPEEEAMRRIERQILKLWQKADKEGKSFFPFEFMYQLIESGELKKFHEIDPAHSWLVAACEKKIPVYTPGWEDSTLGNIYVANVLKKNLSGYRSVKSGLEQMAHLIGWYKENCRKSKPGFFQIGGGIAGDFPICVVPLINQDLKENCPYWGYFCQISDSTTSYGSYSGAVPNEKITWGKLDGDTPRFIIESDASIVAPLVFNYVLGN
ncbi:MAG: deoxyhypusine synthase family protein [Deltaproteobacteria bacterium]|nr:deoxyhypusine synthase family protein [Deltaproteobacteria bacterium]